MCFYFTGISFRLKLAAAPIRDICLQIDKQNFFNNIPHKYGKAEQIYSLCGFDGFEGINQAK